jgi:hypothetical protein
MENNTVTFSYSSDGVSSYGYPPQSVVFTIPRTDSTVHEYYTTFKNFLRAIGFTENLVLFGALKTAVMDDSNDPIIVNKIMADHGIMDIDDHIKKLREFQEEIMDLKAKISRLENPDNPQYTDEEMNAMTYQQMIDSGFEMAADGFWIKK